MPWCNTDRCLRWTTQASCMRLNYICKAASATNLCLDKIPKVLDLCQTMVCQCSLSVSARWRARLTHRCERWSFPSSAVTLIATAAIRSQPSYYKIKCTSVISISWTSERTLARPFICHGRTRDYFPQTFGTKRHSGESGMRNIYQSGCHDITNDSNRVISWIWRWEKTGSNGWHEETLSSSSFRFFRPFPGFKALWNVYFTHSRLINGHKLEFEYFSASDWLSFACVGPKWYNLALNCCQKCH